MRAINAPAMARRQVHPGPPGMRSLRGLLSGFCCTLHVAIMRAVGRCVPYGQHGQERVSRVVVVVPVPIGRLASSCCVCSAYVACVTYDALGLATSAAQLIHDCARTRLEGFVPYAQTPELLASAGLEPSRVDVWTTSPSQGLRFHPL